jgi:2-keto-4-pentenoate hydratase/2-oxohepta-3-ene-1,7-dioic acid hydratase in catechol pathway
VKLARIGDLGTEVPVVIEGDIVYDLSGLTADIDGDFLARDGIGRVRNALGAGELTELALPEASRFGPPIARPSSVVCVGMNYAAHAAESGSAPPEDLVIFFKAANTVAGPYDSVRLPPGSTATDWEVELAVIIGERASYLASPDEAQSVIAGYALANDLSERRLQLEVSGGQWSKGKCAPGFLPLGPWFVPRDDLDVSALRLRSWVNGEPRQDSSTSDMIFGVDHIVCAISQFMTLEPGDVVLTGTPEGVGLSGRFPYLAAGDTVELAIEGLGAQRQEYL